MAKVQTSGYSAHIGPNGICRKLRSRRDFSANRNVHARRHFSKYDLLNSVQVSSSIGVFFCRFETSSLKAFFGDNQASIDACVGNYGSKFVNYALMNFTAPMFAFH
jgi:hypothetical protein